MRHDNSSSDSKPTDCKSSSVSKKNSFGETPLIAECTKGKLHLVQHLVEKDKVNVNERGNFWMHGRIRLRKCTALHAAVMASQVHVVNYLLQNTRINVDATADTNLEIESVTDKGATALHLAACHVVGEDQNEIVLSLLTHGARSDIKNAAGKQWWELATSLDLAKRLLLYGVDRHSCGNSTSSNIAHVWAASKNPKAPELIDMAIEKSVDISQPDANGLTPIMLAAIGHDGRPNLGVFDQIFHQNVQPLSRMDRINALELLGATFMFGGQKEIGFHTWSKAMEYRFGVSGEPDIPKAASALPEIAVLALSVIYKERQELQTKEEVEKAALAMQDRRSLRIQAELVYIRILGLKHKVTLQRLRRSACEMGDGNAQEFLYYTELIMQNCDSTEPYLHFYKPLVIKSMSTIARRRVKPPQTPLEKFHHVMRILQSLLTLLENAREKRSLVVDFALGSIVVFTYIALENELTSKESVELKGLLKRAGRLRKRNRNGNDLLSLACLRAISPSTDSTDNYGYGNRLGLFKDARVSDKVISFLIHSGIDWKTKNDFGESTAAILRRTCRKRLALAGHVLSQFSNSFVGRIVGKRKTTGGQS